jgi:hypothetical protein
MFDLTNIISLRSLTRHFERYLCDSTRCDAPNNPTANGEYCLIENLFGESTGSPSILMDIDANQGNWIARACGVIECLGKHGLVYAIEPKHSTYAFLSIRFKTDNCAKLKIVALFVHTSWHKTVGERML